MARRVEGPVLAHSSLDDSQGQQEKARTKSRTGFSPTLLIFCSVQIFTEFVYCAMVLSNHFDGNNVRGTFGGMLDNQQHIQDDVYGQGLGNLSLCNSCCLQVLHLTLCYCVETTCCTATPTTDG